jgi:hypothetical protein
MTAATVIASVVSALVALLVLGAFLWAAREDGRDQRRRDAGRGFPPHRRTP